MFKRLFIPIVIILLSLATCDHPVDPVNCAVSLDVTSHEPRDISILFIGTSHTYYNDLPAIVKAIGKSIGDQVYTEMSAPGGYDFERHVILESTIKALDSREWDYIVLQESGWRTALPPDMLATKVFPFASDLKNIISEKQPSSTLILYMTQGYVGGVGTFDADWCAAEPAVCSYEGMQERIRDTYIELSKIMGAEVAPTGMVWKALMNKDSQFSLFDADGIHPNLAGSYVNALTIYSVIRRKELRNVFIPMGVADDDALLIQNTVVDMIFQCSPNWTKL
jgi:hypothetical protein